MSKVLDFEKLKNSAFIELDGEMYRMNGVVDDEDSTIALFTDEDTGEEYHASTGDGEPPTEYESIRYFEIKEIA
jgi:hypothetical protein